MATITITNPTRTQKFGFGYSTTPERNSTRIIPPTAPDYTGTFASVQRQIKADRTFQSFKSGGTWMNTCWFYDGKPILNEGEFLDGMNEIYMYRDLAQNGGTANRPEIVTVQI